MRVLIVDDDKNRSQSIKDWLVSQGVSSEELIIIVSCTSTARTSIKDFFYDILILDVVLPKRDNDDKAKWTNGIDLLRYINTSPLAKKPGKIIGITAYTSDIENFKLEFENYCFTIVEVIKGSEEWKVRFSNAFSYQSSSKIASLDDEKKIIAVSVHGIKTFGNWQEKLRALIQNRASYIDFQTYKYGYFLGINFLIPFIRNIQITKFRKKLLSLFNKNNEKKFVFFAHSFGTYIVVKAIDDIIASGVSIPQITLVLSGSVLPSTYDLNKILDHNEKNTIINDCGNNDNILLLSEAFVISTGMAGRTGFYGINNKSLINRYHPGGHSHYFENKIFMEKYWLPILYNEIVVENSDIRPFSFVKHSVVEQLCVMSRKFKILYPIIIIVAIFFIIFNN